MRENKGNLYTHTDTYLFMHMFVFKRVDTHVLSRSLPRLSKFKRAGMFMPLGFTPANLCKLGGLQRRKSSTLQLEGPPNKAHRRPSC